jgi:hypothetical protein
VARHEIHGQFTKRARRVIMVRPINHCSWPFLSSKHMPRAPLGRWWPRRIVICPRITDWSSPREGGHPLTGCTELRFAASGLCRARQCPSRSSFTVECRPPGVTLTSASRGRRLDRIVRVSTTATTARRSSVRLRRLHRMSGARLCRMCVRAVASGVAGLRSTLVFNSVVCRTQRVPDCRSGRPPPSVILAM